MNAELDQYQEGFFVESQEALDSMESALLKLAPGAVDSETINTIFRVAHSIKGGAGMFEFTAIASFLHTLETLLEELRAGRLEVTAQICEGLLQSVDQTRAMLWATQRQQPLDLSVSAVLQEQFRQLVAAVGNSPTSTVRTSILPVAAAAAATATAPLWIIHFKPRPELLIHGSDPLQIFEELSGLGPLVAKADFSAVPALEDVEPARCDIVWELSLATHAPRNSIELIFEWVEEDCELHIERTADTPAGATSAAPLRTIDVKSVRVAIEKIDELLNTVGEIVVTQSMISQLADSIDGVHADRLRSGLGQLGSSIRQLQDNVMRVRMLPVSSVFRRFPRLVHDLSARLGKQIRLTISGEQTELDKTVLEKIGDPLVHLVRNSIDHGIETPEVRLAAGKPVEGTVHLNAFHKGGSIHIVITDDGKGMDKHSLLDQARSKGLVDPAAQLTDEQIYDLIFLPGFTTAAQTTDLSGRGVGMDVVRRNIKELGGSVELRTELGKGTCTTITLPLATSTARPLPSVPKPA